MAVRDFYITEEMAEHYRTTPATVRYWVHVGYGPRSIKVGRRRLWPVDEVARFDAELRQSDPEPAPVR